MADHLVDLLGSEISGGPKAIQCGSNRQSSPLSRARAADLHAEASASGNRSLVGPVADELDGLEQPLAADVADDRVLPRQLLEAAGGAVRPGMRALPQRSRSMISRKHGDPRGAGDRVALECVPLDEAGVRRDRPPEGVGDRPCGRSSPRAARSRRSAPWRCRGRRASTPNVSAANICPVRPMPVMISSKIKRMLCRSQISRRIGRYSCGRVDHPAGVADRLDHDRRDGGRVLHLDHLLDDRRAGDAAFGIALAERAAVTGRREDVQEARGHRLVDRLPRLQPRGRQRAQGRAVPRLVAADDLVLARRTGER